MENKNKTVVKIIALFTAAVFILGEVAINTGLV